jgi:hypothetical protein
MFDGNESHLTLSQSRRTMLTRAAGLSVGAGLGLAGVTRVLAQATPTTGGSSEALEFTNVEGVVIAKLTVNSITDPFSGYNPTYPPPRGNRYILLSVSVENPGTANLIFDPNSIFLQDVDNFILYPASVDLGPEPAEPPLTYQEIPPATTVSGVIGYVLVQGVALARVFYSPARDRMALLLEIE